MEEGFRGGKGGGGGEERRGEKGGGKKRGVKERTAIFPHQCCSNASSANNLCVDHIYTHTLNFTEIHIFEACTFLRLTTVTSNFDNRSRVASHNTL